MGIGGIGMSALARYFHLTGKKVSGYDRVSSPITNSLEKLGINTWFKEDLNQIKYYQPKNTLVVLTPAIPKNSIQLNHFLNSGFEIKKRSEVLGIISSYTLTHAVAGTHGKTTTSAILSHILHHSGFGCNAFLGGIATNYQSNLIFNKESNHSVVEADEFDRSFLTLKPHSAIITSTDADHLDIYGKSESLTKAFEEFAALVKPEGFLMLKKGLSLKLENNKKVLTYAISEQADYSAQNLRVENHRFCFDIAHQNKTIIKDIHFQLPGNHNTENAVAASAVAHQLGIETIKIKAALNSFTGVKRRFEFIHETTQNIYIDDYAHHPQELKATISAVRKLYPEKKITGIFQPHLFSRTKDFAQEFAQSLDGLDQLYLLDIYPARELPMPEITSATILEKMQLNQKEIIGKEELINKLKKTEHEVVLSLGAGDIGLMTENIKNALNFKSLSAA